MAMFEGDYEVMGQPDMIKYAAEERGSGPWTVLYGSWWDEHANNAEFAAMAPTSMREQVLKISTWELSIGDGAPGLHADLRWRSTSKRILAARRSRR